MTKHKPDDQAGEKARRAAARDMTRQANAAFGLLPEKATGPQKVRYTTHLTPAIVKAIKTYALAHDLKDYQVVQQAIEEFLSLRPTAK